MKRADLPIDPEQPFADLFEPSRESFRVAMMDGTIRVIKNGMDLNEFAELLTWKLQ